MVNFKKFTFFFLLLAFLVVGCASNQQRINDMESRLSQQESEIGTLKTDVAAKEREAERYKMEAEKQAMEAKKAKEMAMSGDTETTTMTPRTSSSELFPPNPKPGECYARVFVSPTYDTVTERVLKKESSARLKVVPASYETIEERVLVAEETSVLKVVPAKYDWVSEKVLVKPEHTIWKKGRGLIEKIDNTTGEIMCLIKVPAKYKTVKKRVQVSPARTETVVIPAKYKTVKVRKEARKPEVVKTDIPEEWQDVTKRVKVTEGYMEWRSVLCETNMIPGLISSLQRALKGVNHDPGPIDGVYGRRTTKAVHSYQQSKGMAVGGLTGETLSSLGVYTMGAK